MSTDYRLACFTCQTTMPGAFASGSGFYGFKVWDTAPLMSWLGHGEAVGAHEGHDLRIVSEHVELEWEWDGDDYLGPRHSAASPEPPDGPSPQS